MSGFTEVRALSGQTRWRRWAVAAVSGRLLATMMVLAYVIIGEDRYGSIAFGALLASAATFSAGVAAPALGRLLDRSGLRRGLIAALAITIAILPLQIAVASTGSMRGLLLALAALQGVGYSAVPGAYRAMLAASVSEQDLPRANTVDAVLTEVGYVTGPAVAGVVASVWGPISVLVAMMIVTAIALIITWGLPDVAPSAAGAVSPLRRPTARVVYGFCLLVGMTFGLLETAVAARVVELGYAAASTGILLTLVALGSGAAGLAVSGMDDQRGRVAVRACSAFALLSGALVVTASAPNIVLLGAVLVVVGVPIAPLNAIGAQRLQDNLERRQLGEGFALFSALILIGVGLGNYATAQLLDVLGPSGLLLCAGALMGVAAVLLAPAARAQWASTDRHAHV